MLNHAFLMKHISYNLHTIVRRYSRDRILLDYFCARADYTDSQVTDDIMALFTTFLSQENIPLLLSVNNQIIYGLVPSPEYFYIIGPVRFPNPMYFKYKASIKNLSPELLDSVTVCEFSDFTKNILLAFNLYQEQEYDENTLYEQNCFNPGSENEIQRHFSDLIFENREYEKRHNPYDQELREVTSIEHGDLEQLKKSIEEDYIGEIGTLAKDPLRHTKNLAIVVITNAFHAAIRGGLAPEIAFSLSDSYIQKVEELNAIPSLIHHMRSAEFHYAQMVRDINDEKAGIINRAANPHINKCKDYVFSHLHGKITVQEIADELHINPNYLSELFHKSEKISLSDYIKNEKIKLVKNLLIYSHYSYSEISTYLGYSSQSHLGQQFKQMTGLTLRQYRTLYGVKEFRQ